MKSGYKLFNMPWYYFAIFSVLVLLATMVGVLPAGMAGCFAFMIVFGTIFQEIGDKLPIVRSYLGGGAIVVIFGMGILRYVNFFGVFALFTPAKISCAQRGTDDIKNSMHHSHSESGVHPKALTRNGISVTAACRHKPIKNEAAISRLDPKPAENTEQSTLRMPTAWNSSESPRTVKA